MTHLLKLEKGPIFPEDTVTPYVTDTRVFLARKKERFAVGATTNSVCQDFLLRFIVLYTLKSLILLELLFLNIESNEAN